jgi:hypothetical protein
MDWHFLSGKNKLVIRYLLIILVFVLLALGVFLFFKFKIKMMERENEPGVPTEQQKSGTVNRNEFTITIKKQTT